MLEFYRSNPNALERFRAPVFEDKVVAFLSELADINESVVEPEDLFRDPDEVADPEKNPKKEKDPKGTAKKAEQQEATKKTAKNPVAKKNHV